MHLIQIMSKSILSRCQVLKICLKLVSYQIMVGVQLRCIRQTLEIRPLWQLLDISLRQWKKKEMRNILDRTLDTRFSSIKLIIINRNKTSYSTRVSTWTNQYRSRWLISHLLTQGNLCQNILNIEELPQIKPTEMYFTCKID